MWHSAPVKKTPAPTKKPTQATAEKKKTAPKKAAPAPKKAASAPKKAAPAPKQTAPSKPMAAKKPAPRADLGAPIDGWFDKQKEPIRGIAEALRRLILEAAPDAQASIKWGMPFFTRGGMMCAIGGHKAHVNLILAGGPGTYADPKGLLEGEGTTGRHLKLRSLADLPVADVRGWLRAAAKQAPNSVRQGLLDSVAERGADPIHHGAHAGEFVFVAVHHHPQVA